MRTQIFTLLFILSFNLMASDQPYLKVEVHARNFSSSDQVKLDGAIEILEVVMNSEEFKQRILSYDYAGTGGFYQNNGMSNQEIYHHLMSGAEVLRPDTDHTMNFDLSLYRSWNPFSKVKGYTTPDSMRIFIHKKFFRRKSWTSLNTAANMAHEWVHKMGFGHDFYHNDDRPHSVPYAIGTIVGEMAAEMGYE